MSNKPKLQGLPGIPAGMSAQIQQQGVAMRPMMPPSLGPLSVDFEQYGAQMPDGKEIIFMSMLFTTPGGINRVNMDLDAMQKVIDEMQRQLDQARTGLTLETASGLIVPK